MSTGPHVISTPSYLSDFTYFPSLLRGHVAHALTLFTVLLWSNTLYISFFCLKRHIWCLAANYKTVTFPPIQQCSPLEFKVWLWSSDLISAPLAHSSESSIGHRANCTVCSHGYRDRDRHRYRHIYQPVSFFIICFPTRMYTPWDQRYLNFLCALLTTVSPVFRTGPDTW